MKRTILLCLALSLGILFGSCQRDIPNIEFVNVVSHTSDFSSIIDAINDQSETMAVKLDLVKDAVINSSATLGQKISLIEKAVEKGITTYEEMAKLLIEAINNLNVSQADKLQAIYDIMNSSSASLMQKLADVEAAVKAGFVDEKEAIAAMAAAIEAAIDNQTLAQTTAFTELRAAVDEGLVDVVVATAALQEALVKEMQDSTNNLADKLQALNDVIALGFEASTDMIETLKDEIMQQLLDDSVALSDKLETIKAAIATGFAADAVLIEQLKNTFGEDFSEDLFELLTDIKTAIESGADYTDLIMALEILIDPRYNGYAYVDLGLPSGMLWATCNLGAAKPEEFGGYYGWGMTIPYSATDDVYAKLYLQNIGSTGGIASIDYGTDLDPLKEYLKGGSKYSKASKAGTADGIGGTAWDAASQSWKGEWRMPTKSELWELRDNCDMEETELNNVKGVKFTSKSNGRSIFLPYAGVRFRTNTVDTDGIFYWSSSPYDGAISFVNAFDYGFCLQYLNVYHYPREKGLSIRPVIEPRR